MWTLGLIPNRTLSMAHMEILWQSIIEDTVDWNTLQTDTYENNADVANARDTVADLYERIVTGTHGGHTVADIYERIVAGTLGWPKSG